MAVNLTIPNEAEIFAVPGVEIGVTEANIRKENRKDLTVIKLSSGSSVAGVFTRNRFRAAPVQVCESHLAMDNEIRALVINTGNANAGTGTVGLENARTVCDALAKALGVLPEQILPFSTGVILEPLPVGKIILGLPNAIKNLGKNEWFNASHGIMTTDTKPKIHSRQITLDNRQVTITGISKGAGMICPNMATMLGFVATDAEINNDLLQKMTKEIANKSFNRITVDGDTSTNDSFIMIATGQSGVQINNESSAHYKEIKQALTEAALDLAQKIVRDAEGATKFITVKVNDAKNEDEALKVAYAVAHSPLVKTAFFASDPNLGRILAAIGYAGIDDLDVNHISLWLDDVLVALNGGRNPDYLERQGQEVMAKPEITITINLNRGNHNETIYTCDLSHDYVSINADYRS